MGSITQVEEDPVLWFMVVVAIRVGGTGRATSSIRGVYLALRMGGGLAMQSMEAM